MVVGYGYLVPALADARQPRAGVALKRGGDAGVSAYPGTEGSLAPAAQRQLPAPPGSRENKHWKCRAGARHFEVDGAGLGHLCQPKTGSPAKPLVADAVADIRRQLQCGKPCAARCPMLPDCLCPPGQPAGRLPAPAKCPGLMERSLIIPAFNEAHRAALTALSSVSDRWPRQL